jgi:hypothetical protein
MWTPTPRVGRSRFHALATARRTLGHSGSCWQAWTHSNRANARLGQDDTRRVDSCSRASFWKSLPVCMPSWKVLGQRRHRARCLARGQVVRRESWLCWSGSSRLETFVREALPFCRRRVGTDSIPARPCFGPNYRVLSRLQTTNSWSCKRPYRYRTVARPIVNR